VRATVIVVFLTLLGLALVLSGCGRVVEGRAAAPADLTVASAVPVPPPDPVGLALKRPSAGRWIRPAGPVAAPRPKLPEPFTVRRALRRAMLAGHLRWADYITHRNTYRAARRAAARLTGVRRSELSAVLEQVRDLARARLLTPSRMPLAFTLLARNTLFWTSAPIPSVVAGRRLTFARDPLIYRWYPGEGLQVQYLANFGRASAAARACQVKLPGQTCRPAGLRALVERLVALGVPRRGGLVWESWFRFGGARAGWISAMTQGVAAQALARTSAALGWPQALTLARRAIRPFSAPPPAGVAVPARGGRFYVMYSTLPSLRILNGHLQAITGLRDAARLGAGRRAWRAFHRGDHAARAALGAFDTGAWSRYSLGGAEADLNYHELMTTQLTGLCARTQTQDYCREGRRFTRYLREPPRIDLHVVRRLRWNRAGWVRFGLSKISDVTVTVSDRYGWRFLRRFRVPRGGHALRWVPPHHGHYRVTVAAVGLSGPRAATTRTVLVRRKPRPRHRKHAKHPKHRKGSDPSSAGHAGGQTP
jgi:hypothetical protein